MTRSSLALALLLLACGPAGTLTGKVTVEGGSAGNLAVLVYGPVSTATVTKDDGTFSATSLPDGAYVVRVVLKGAEVEDQSVPGSIKGGKTDVAPNLTFKLPGGKVTGKVVFTDGSDPSKLAVTLTGTASRGTTTSASGAFTFDSVPTGAYLVEVAAPDTREGKVGVGVAVAGMSNDVGTLTLTPVGRVAGKVTLGGMAQEGVTVTVAGTELRATTNTAGAFAFSAVPAGNQTFVARTTAPATRVANLPVMVARGDNADVTLALMDETRTGTVTGSVTFLGQQSPSIITVSVPGTSVSANPGPNGAFTLQVPAGSWDVVATAPHFAKTILGHVFVAEGVSQALPSTTLSWYEPLWVSSQPLTQVSTVASATPWFLVQVADSQGFTRMLLVNRSTRDARLLYSGTVNSPQFSKTGKMLGFFVNDQVITYDTAAGVMKAWGDPVGVAQPVLTFTFSSDETTLFITRTSPSTGPGPFLERIVLATGALTRYPSTGLAQQVARHTVDRFLVWETTNDVTLVQPTSDTPRLFTQVSSLFATPTPAALVACTTTCTIKVVAPTGTTASTVAGTFPVNAIMGGFTNTNGDYPFVFTPLTSVFSLIRASDGALFPLPAPLNNFIFNSTGTRYAATSTSGTTFQLREEALPPTNPAPLAQSTGGISFAYASPTRLLAIDQAVPRRIIDVKNGVATIDADVLSAGPTANLVYRYGPGLLWPSASKWKTIIGDQPVLGLDGVPNSVMPTAVIGRPGEPVSSVGYVSFDSGTTWVIDGAQGVARRSNAGSVIAAERWGTTEVWRTARGSSPVYVTVGATEQSIEPENYSPLVSNVLTTSDRTVFAASGNQLLIAWPR